jgi:hypothetical protein
MSYSNLPTAIVSSPLATSPRETYAGTVASTDPACADFVRSGIDALRATVHARRDTDAAAAAASRAARLWRANEARWAPNEPGVRFGFVRGMPEQVTCTCDTWRATGATLRARYPILHLDAKGPARELAGHLDGLLSLSLAAQPQAVTDLDALFDDPAAQRLVWLDLSYTGLGLDAIDVLVQRAPGLRYLAFEGNPEGTPTAWWVPSEIGLVPAGRTVARKPDWGAPEWLEMPAFQCEILVPALYYPYPDL